MTAEVLEQTEYGIRRDEGDGDVEGIAVRERIADFIMHGEVAWAVRNQRWLIAFGGVLPGFDPDTKIKLLQRMKDKIDIVICIYAGDIEQKIVLGAHGPRALHIIVVG